MKNVSRVYRASDAHWVGDGFPVWNMFSYGKNGEEISPFLLLDYAGPQEFEPSSQPRGVGQHPHRGFETVTVVYQGEVAHSDSAGNSGTIGPGDVQWMTAARGILHEEMHGHDFTKQGGMLEMVQLWVNLPARDKMSAPGYQDIRDRDIPVVQLGDVGSFARVIAGELDGTRGPARTHTPVNLWDVRLTAGSKTTLSVPDGHTTLMLVLKGSVEVNVRETVNAAELVMFERDGDAIVLEAGEDAVLLVMDGEPIDEPVVGQGPFVMNTAAEIGEAYADFRAGRFAAQAESDNNGVSHNVS